MIYNGYHLILEDVQTQEQEIANLPINKPLPFDPNLLLKAMELGMIVILKYKGAKDILNWGRERTIYPLIWGVSPNGNQNLRAWHLTGYSVSKKGFINKVWRMFRLDRIKQMTLTGSFFKIPPEGFKKDSPGFPSVIKMVSFEDILKKQTVYTKAKTIQVQQPSKEKFQVIIVEQTGTDLDLTNPYLNKDVDKSQNTIISILKNVQTGAIIALKGTAGVVESEVGLINNNIQMGMHKVLKIITGPYLQELKTIEGKTLLPLYIKKYAFVPVGQVKRN